MGQYSDAIRESQDEIARQRARSAGLTAPAVSPDDMGRAIAKSERTGQPPAVVAENLAQYDEQDHLDQITRVSGDAPALAHWLGDPNQNTLAKDDLSTLGGIASWMTKGILRNAQYIPGMQFPGEVLRQRAAETASTEPPQPSWFSELRGQLEAGWFEGKQGATLLTPMVDTTDEVARGLGYDNAAAYSADRRAAEVANLGRKVEAADVTSRSTERGLQEIQAAGERGWGDLSGAILRNPRAVMSVVARSIGATAPTLAASAVPVTRLMTAAVAGSGSALTEQGFTVLDVMRENGVDTSDAVDVARFMRDKEAMAAARAKGVKRGVAVGVFDALTAGFAGRLIANSRRSVLSVAPRVVGEGLVQAGGGAAGEATAQVATEGRVTDRAAVGLEAAAEVPTFLAEGRGQIAEARRAALHNADRFNAQSEQSAITRLVTLSSESKTRARSAKRFESLIQSMTTEGEDTVYVPAEAMRTLFQSAAEGEQHPLAGLVSAQDVNEAVATGGEIAIPLAQYATYMTPEQHAAIADQVRLQPGGRQDLPSVSAEEIQQAIADGLAEAQQQEERETGPAGQVYDEIYGQLLSKQDEKLARQNASIVQSVYRNLAERSGTDAWTLFNQFRINIPGATRDVRGAPRGVDTDVDPLLDALRSGKLPTDDEIIGESLSAALVRAGGLRADEGGELAALEANRRPGLVTNAGMSLDDALVWAHQQGFIDEAPTQLQDQFNDAAPDIQTFLDLLGRDLVGQRVGRPSQRNVKREAFRADAQALQEEVDARGINLAETDNQRAREALGLSRQTEATTEENDQREAEGLPRLYQSAVPESSELEQLRARVAELERELRTDRLTGLRNQRAFEEDEALGWPVVAAADMDGLKRLNDSVGHEAADQVLRVLGGIMLAEEGVNARFYRRSGDEFSARFQDQETADRIMADLQARLEEVAIDFDVTDADGNIQPLTYEGIGISYGNGPDYAAADAAANRNKADRLAAGVREEARADGQPRRLRPRRDSRWGEGRRAGEGQARPAEVGDGSTLNQSPVDTPAFKAWFGDSKVVDDNGDPLVVYHGGVSGLDVFQNPMVRAADFLTPEARAKVVDASYFTRDKRVADSYRRRIDDQAYRDSDPTGETYSVYLSIQNPKVFDLKGAKYSPSMVESQIEKAVAEGHDGVIVKNVVDDFNQVQKPTTIYITFNPKQIKSATANRGTFDPLNPSILFQPAFHGTPHDVDRFSLQKIGTGEGAQAFGWGLYFAGKRSVAEHYRDRLTESNAPVHTVTIRGKSVAPDSPEGHGARLVFHNSKPEMKRLAKQMLADAKAGDPYTVETAKAQGLDPVTYYTRVSDTINDLKKSDVKVHRGRLYEVDIPEDADLIDNEAPITKQNDKVKDVARQFLIDEGYLKEGQNGDRQLASSFKAMGQEKGGMVKGPDGQLLYEVLAKKLGSEQAASQYLNEHGIPGLKYKAGQIIGGRTNEGHNYVIWDEGAISDPSLILDQSERGSVTFRRGEDGGRQFDIQLLAGMDASTFMHEMGHVYLEVLNDLAARDDAPQQMKDDVATIDAWVKREAGQPYTVEQHEQFARGFEAYLREGNAPTSALRRAFAAFKVWLTAIYRSALALNVELTSEVREVFDRIVASDAEIAEARQEQYLEPLIGDALAVGMSAEDFARYNAAVIGARADAEAVVAAELLRAMQIEQRAWYREERKRVQAEVTQQMREAPAYRAQRLLRTGKLPDGTEAPEVLRIKLDKEDLLDRYGQDFLRNLRGTYAVEGGVPSDEAADILGFRSGAELVNQLVNAPPLSEAIRAETDARMKERHPDPMTDGTLPDRAMVAAHRDRQADVMVREIRALEGMNGGRPKTEAAVVKGIAKRIIDGKKLRALQPATYRAAEAKAGREAFEAASRQQWAEAAAARRRQLLNFELFREAVRARNEATATARYLAKFGQTKTRQRLGKARGEYLEQIDALLDRFDFRKISDKAADRRASLAAWIKSQTERGIQLDLPAGILDEAFRLPFRELTTQQLRDVRDAVRAIDHLARLKGKLLLGNEVRDAAEIDADMAASVRAATAEQKVTTGDKTKSAKVLQAFRQGRAFLQATATDLARELDGFTNGGAVWRNTVGVVRDAVNNRVNPELRKAQQALAEIYVKHYTKEEIRDFSNLVPMPEVNGDLWSRRRLLALALNWGNAGNREAILTQQKARITKGQADALLGRLDARDWAFVQEVWALVDSYWPEISEAQKRRTGLSPEKVEASPFVVRTSDGKTLAIPGGYYPLKYEADSIKTMKDEADDFYESIRTGRSAKAATRNGHTIERVGSGGRTVALDTSLIQTHLRDVIRDLYLGDAVNYVHGVLNGSEFRQAIDATGQQEYAKALEVWLKDVAAGEIGPRVWHERAMRAVRTNFTASVLAFKPVSAILQVTGIIQSSVVIGQADVWQGVAQYLRQPIAMTKYVTEASPYMASRMQTHVEAVQQVMDAEAGRWKAGQAAAIRFGYWMMGRVQQTVDVASWLAAENQGMRLFDNDIAKARAHADDAVSRAQSSGEFIDKNPIQRGTLGDNVRQSEWIKAAAVLQSYMYAKGNAAYELTRKTNFKSPVQAARWGANMVMLFAVEALIVAAIRGKLPDDDDDDGYADEYALLLAKETSANLIGAIPGGGTMVSELRGYDSKGVMASAWEEVGKLRTQVAQGEADRGLVKAAVTVSGVTMGLPSAQINKTIDAVTASADGEDVSPYEYLTGPSK